jgi:DtxR family Mn-dependent transcriptional regulator
MGYEPSEHHPAFEEYSETIFGLAEDGIDVIQARIAERLDVSRPAVSEMIKRMQESDLVELDDDGIIGLTVDGRVLATTVVRRHRIAECFLTEILGLSWTDSHHEAGRWEHVISPVVEAALLRVLKNPKTCPHGNPIPGAGYQAPDGTRPLVEVQPNSGFTVERIPEELEFQAGQLAFLEQSRIVPGQSGTVLSIAPDGTLTVSMGDSAVGIGAFTAARILVTAS